MVKAGHRKHGRDIGLIVHLSASTSLNPDPNDKVLVCTVEEAIVHEGRTVDEALEILKG